MTETAYDIHRLQPCTCGVGDTKQHVLKAVQRTASAESSSYEMSMLSESCCIDSHSKACTVCVNCINIIHS